MLADHGDQKRAFLHLRRYRFAIDFEGYLDRHAASWGDRYFLGTCILSKRYRGSNVAPRHGPCQLIDCLAKGLRQAAFLNCWHSMKQYSVFPAFIALTAILLCASGCQKRDAPAAVAGSKPALDGGARTVRIRAAQMQFLGIEPAGADGGSDVLALPGRIAFSPQAQFAIGAAMAGRVAAVLVRAGQVVKAGAPLLTIDSADAAAGRAALDQAATRLASAESMLKRQVEMVEKGVGLEIDRQDAEARLKEARAEHERARHTAGLIGSGQGIRFTVRAPADGVVSAIRVAAGATVIPGGEALVELGDPARLLVIAQVPEAELRRIAAGQQAEVEIPALAARIAARIENFNPRVDPESRRAQLYLTLAARTEGLRAGMLAQAFVHIASEPGLSIPAAAVLIKDGKRRVVYVERADGEFVARDVQTGRNRNGRVVILEGLKAGERIVVRGALLLDTQAEQLL
ncbi:MAG: efflux RND transporter periplasmic adaptor subunit [Betaproteobacteria bacterium]